MSEKKTDSENCVSAWLAWFSSQKGASEASVRAYGRDVLQFVEFLKDDAYKDREITLINADFRSIEAFIGQLYRKSLSKSSIARKLSTLNSSTTTPFCTSSFFWVRVRFCIRSLSTKNAVSTASLGREI